MDVDARGLLCPLPVLRLAKAIAVSPGWTRIRLLATDPDSQADVEAFCQARGFRLVRATIGEILEFEIARYAQSESDPRTEN